MAKHDLSNREIARYSRQLILEQFSISCQKLLKESKVLVVGCGGLGCPAAIYLASVGVGEIGLVDDDVVELSNLHRQIGHSEFRIGENKAESLKRRCNEVNSDVKIYLHKTRLIPENAVSIISNYDCVLDCTDNAPTRYLINDACVLSNHKPLVSGSAIRLEGQLTVYIATFSQRVDKISHERPPCYRCLYPEPPPSEAVGTCSEQGVLGIVPGVIGTMQASETVKILTGAGVPLAGRLLIYEFKYGNIRTIQLRKRNLDCIICGENPRNPLVAISPQMIDYVHLCNGVAASDKEPSINSNLDFSRLSDLAQWREERRPHILIDIRPKFEIEICALDRCIFINENSILRSSTLEELIDKIQSVQTTLEEPIYPFPVLLLCHRGNASHALVPSLSRALNSTLAQRFEEGSFKKPRFTLDDRLFVSVQDIAGGLAEWASQIDPNFPIY